MFTRKTIPFIVGSILLVAVAFLFLTRALDWTYVSDFYKDEPTVIVVPEEEPLERVKLEVAVSLDAQQYEELVGLSEKIKEQYPQLDVQIINYGEEHYSYEDWQRLARLGELGDIQLVANEWVVPLAIQGLYQPIDRLMNNEALSDQLPGIVDALKWNGYMWAVPYESNPYLLFVHQQAAAQLRQSNVGEDEGGQADRQANGVPLDNQQAGTDSEDAPEQEHQGTEGQAEAGQTDEEQGDVLQALSEASEQGEEQQNGTDADEAASFDWSIQAWLKLYEELSGFEGPLLNVDPEQFSSLLVWLAPWHNAEAEPIQLMKLTEQQQETLDVLQNNLSIVQPSLTIEGVDAAQLPLLYMTTVRHYYEQRQLIEQHYSNDWLMAPLPWMNGKSFMLSANTFGTQKSEAAMQWLEMINRLQPRGTIIHRKFYSLASSDAVQAQLSQLLQQKLRNSQMLAVDPQLASRYELLQQRWLKADGIERKLQVFQINS